jgi:hypothetical protein
MPSSSSMISTLLILAFLFQIDKKSGPYGFLRLEPDNAIMVKDNPFDNRQAQAGSFLLGGVVRVEYPFPLILGYPWTIVLYLDSKVGGVAFADGDDTDEDLPLKVHGLGGVFLPGW